MNAHSDPVSSGAIFKPGAFNPAVLQSPIPYHHTIQRHQPTPIQPTLARPKPKYAPLTPLVAPPLFDFNHHHHHQQQQQQHDQRPLHQSTTPAKCSSSASSGSSCSNNNNNNNGGHTAALELIMKTGIVPRSSPRPVIRQQSSQTKQFKVPSLPTPRHLPAQTSASMPTPRHLPAQPSAAASVDTNIYRIASKLSQVMAGSDTHSSPTTHSDDQSEVISILSLGARTNVSNTQSLPETATAMEDHMPDNVMDDFNDANEDFNDQIVQETTAVKETPFEIVEAPIKKRSGRPKKVLQVSTAVQVPTTKLAKQKQSRMEAVIDFEQDLVDEPLNHADARSSNEFKLKKPLKKPRKPRKKKTVENEEDTIEEPVERKRGRPKKNASENAEAKANKKVIDDISEPGVHFDSWNLKRVIVTTSGTVPFVVEGLKYIPGSDERVQWHSSAIVTRVDSRRVKSGSGNTYHLHGALNVAQMKSYGFPTSIIGAFRDGFPENWKELFHTSLKQAKSSAPFKEKPVPAPNNVTKSVGKPVDKRAPPKKYAKVARPVKNPEPLSLEIVQDEDGQNDFDFDDATDMAVVEKPIAPKQKPRRVSFQDSKPQDTTNRRESRRLSGGSVMKLEWGTGKVRVMDVAERRLSRGSDSSVSTASKQVVKKKTKEKPVRPTEDQEQDHEPEIVKETEQPKVMGLAPRIDDSDEDHEIDHAEDFNHDAAPVEEKRDDYHHDSDYDEALESVDEAPIQIMSPARLEEPTIDQTSAEEVAQMIEAITAQPKISRTPVKIPSKEPRHQPVSRTPQPTVNISEPSIWAELEDRVLERAMFQQNPQSQDFWQLVADQIPGKSSAQCQQRYQSNFGRLGTKQKLDSFIATRKTNDKAPGVVDETIVLAKRGTLTRKRQIRNIMMERNRENDGDDLFEANPTLLSPERKRILATRSDDALGSTSKRFKSSDESEKSSDIESTGEVQEPMPESPDILKPFNADDKDGYIQHLQRRDKQKWKKNSVSIQSKTKPPTLSLKNVLGGSSKVLQKPVPRTGSLVSVDKLVQNVQRHRMTLSARRGSVSDDDDDEQDQRYDQENDTMSLYTTIAQDNECDEE